MRQDKVITRQGSCRLKRLEDHGKANNYQYKAPLAATGRRHSASAKRSEAGPQQGSAHIPYISSTLMVPGIGDRVLI